jgi:DNA-binding GntR family transcriptional regulator
VLRDGENVPAAIWDEHAAILDAVIAGEVESAEALSRRHILRAAKMFIERLEAQQLANAAEFNVRSRRISR